MKINKKSLLVSILIAVILLLLYINSYRYDSQIFDFISSIKSNELDFWMLFITNLGNLITFLVINLMVLILLDYRTGKNVFEILLLSLLTNTLIKNIINRPRPESAILFLTDYSFPSAHMMVSTCFYGYLCYLMKKSDARKGFKLIFYISMILLILMIGFSRIYLNVHYLSDVLGGLLIGFLLLLVFILYTKNKHKLIDEQIRLDKSFKYAFEGIKTVVLYEKNMHIHVLVAFIVVVMGVFFNINKYEWFTCLILFGIVMSGEIFNTAIEKCVDYISLEKNKQAKIIKDMAAGAVLVNAIVAAIIGLIIFIPKIIMFLK